SRPDVDLFSVDGPGQHAVDPVDRLFKMVVAMRRSGEALRAGDIELKGRDAATRIFAGDQEMHRERAETDGLVGRIDVQRVGMPLHLSLLYGKANLPSYSKSNLPDVNPSSPKGGISE